MNGVFATYAPTLAERGLAVLPCGGEDGKRPLIANWSGRRLDTRAIAKLAKKFGDANVAIATGEVSNLTVIDVDDEACLQEAIKRFGETPIQTRTPRGRHLFYRASGERNTARLDGCPIDVRGKGGYVIAPPSRNPQTGGRYELIGSWDDLPYLAPIANGALEKGSLLRRGAQKGERNKQLFRYGLRQVASCDDEKTLLDCLVSENDNWADPLEEAEVAKVAKSVWKYETAGRNWVGTGAKVLTTREDFDPFLGDSDAHFLWTALRLCHDCRQGGTFVLANATATRFNWTEARFKKARRKLVEMGLLEMTWKGGNGPGDPPQFRLI